ncbi:hypothetical protein [Vreelandella sp. EE7]
MVGGRNGPAFKLNPLAFNYLLCMSAYRLVKDAYQAGATFLSNHVMSNEFVVAVVTVHFAYVLIFLCGLAMGMLTAKKVILHSAAATSASVALDSYFITIATTGNHEWVIFMLFLGALLGGMGGAAALCVKRLQNRRSRRLP